MAIDWGNFTLKQILGKKYPPEFWIWAGWVDRGRKWPRPVQVTKWISAHGPVPKVWYLRYYVHKGLKPPVFHPPPVPVPPPVPPATPLVEIYKKAVVCAQDPLSAMTIPSDYTFWLTADPKYDPGQNVVTTLKSKFKVGAWCNPVQISQEIFLAFCKKYDIHPEMRMGQSETANEFDASVSWGLKVTVGQLASLRSDQKKKIANHEVFHLEEDYWNVMPWMVPDFQGLPVVATVKGVYDGKSDSPTYGRYLGPQDYISVNRWYNGDGFYHAAGPMTNDPPRLDDYSKFP